jgi:hypothetical protein
MTYQTGARVKKPSPPDYYEVIAGPTTPTTLAEVTEGAVWTNLGEFDFGFWELIEEGIPYDERLIHATAHTRTGDTAPWVAQLFGSGVMLSRASTVSEKYDFPSGWVASEGSRLLSAWGSLFFFPGLGSALSALVLRSGMTTWETLDIGYPPPAGERVTSPLPGGQVVLEHRGRILVGRGEELYVSDLLEPHYSRTEGVEVMPGGLGEIRAMISMGAEVIVWREVGIFRVSNLDSLDDWVISPVTYAKGAAGPDAVAVAGGEVWFFADDGIYSLRQVFDQGDGRLGVGDNAASLPIAPTLTALLVPSLRRYIRVVVFGSRVIWAIPVQEDEEGRVLHRCFVWRQDVRLWESVWAQGSVPAPLALLSAREDSDDWQITAWVPLVSGGVERLFHVGDEGCFHWLTGTYDDIRPWDRVSWEEEGEFRLTARLPVPLLLRTRGLAWENEGTVAGQRVRIEGRTWDPTYTFAAIGADGRRWQDRQADRTHNPRKGLKVGMGLWDDSNVDGRHSRDGREDYALTLPSGDTTAVLHTVEAVETLRLQSYTWHIRAPGDGRYYQVEVLNKTGLFSLGSVGMELTWKRRSSVRRNG